MPTPAVGSAIKFTNVCTEFALSINPPSRAMGANFRFASGTYTPASPAIPTGTTAAISLSSDLGRRTKATPSGGLYTWPVSTAYTFTATTWGATTGATVPTSYAGLPFYPTYISMPQAGYQYLTIGNTGTYTIRVAGAAGGSSSPGAGGPAAIVQATGSLTQGDVLIICCGQKGLGNGGINGTGGGGMSAVFYSSAGTGAAVPWIVGAGGGGAAGPGTGTAGAVFNGATAPSAFVTEATASAIGAGGPTQDRSTGSGTQVSVATSLAQPAWSYGLINAAGTRLGGGGCTALAGATDGGWGGAGCGGGGSGAGGSAGGWVGGTAIPAGKAPGNPGTSMIRSTLASRSYIGANPGSAAGSLNNTTGNGYVTITRAT